MSKEFGGDALRGARNSDLTVGTLSHLMFVKAVFLSHFTKESFLAAVVLGRLWVTSGIFENQGAAIAVRDF